MKYFKDENGAVFAFQADGSEDEFIPLSLISISKEEADALRAVPASQTRQQQIQVLMNRLVEIDAASIRPARAVATAFSTSTPPSPQDVARLQDLEAQAVALRDELASLSEGV